MTFVALISAAIAFAPTLLAGQSAGTDSAPPSGSRVRVTAIALGGQRVIGTLVSMNNDSVSFTPAGLASVTSLKTKDVERLEVSHGRRPHLWRAPLIGFLVGAGLAWTAAAVTWSEKRSGFVDFGRWGDAGFAAIPGGLIGLLVGSNLGGQDAENWRSVPLSRRVQP